MSALVIKNAHILDPDNLDMPGDVTIIDGKIARVSLADMRKNLPPQATVVDANGLMLVPGLIDMHTHLRDPGQTHKETIASGSAAAVRGGFTTVCCMANTNPVIDNLDTAEYIEYEARRVGLCRVYPYGAVTQGLMGQELTDFGALKNGGVIGFSDDGVPVMQSDIMLEAMKKAAELDVPIISHCEDTYLARGKAILRDSPYLASLELEGIPAATETIMVIRDLFLAQISGCPVHIAHVSTKQSVDAIRYAKKHGVKVTCETAPHYFILTKDAVEEYGANAKMNPPLGTEEDRAAVIQGLADGTIDVIATDHAPHTADEKNQGLAYAPNGIVGLETALPLSLSLAKQGLVPFNRIIAALTRKPAQILRLKSGIYEGLDGDLTLINPTIGHTINADEFASRGKNTPFNGMHVNGMVAMTVVGGKIVWQNKALM